MEPGQTSVKRSDILTAFEGFREELDDHNDRRERIIKTNRDITNFSKKLIFQLHRITQDENTTEGRAKAIAKLQNKFAEVQALYAKLQPDLVGEWGRKYARSVSGGLQELIEALSLRHYLLHNAMISSTEVQNFVTSDSGTRYLELSNADYLLGISDLTGELMRLAISTITRPGGRDRALHIAQFVRKCVADFESFTPHIRDLVKKQHETNASLRKIEDALYAVRVREYEHHGEGTFDDVISHFTYSFERPQQPLDIEIDTFTIGPGGKSYHVTAELDQKLTLNYDWLEMSDDEYFDDDDIFNSAELDTIPSLNESSENSVAVVPQNEIPRSTTAPAQPSGSRRPPQTPGRTPSGSTRLSTIMNALRASAQGALSSRQPPAPHKKSVFGPSNGLLGPSGSKSVDHPNRRKRNSTSSRSVSPSGSRNSPQKRTRRSPSLGTERRSSACPSPTKALIAEVSESSRLEGKAEGRIEAWSAVEEESTCAICYDLYVAPQLTACGHTVCAPCLKQWLTSRTNCPMCRTQLDSKQKATDNLFCANLIDRLFNEHPDWYPGKPKRVEWNKRKQAWDREVTIANTRPRRSTAAYARVPVTPQPQRLLFNPDSDDEDDDFFRGDENFRQEFLHELALQGRAFRFQIYD